MVVPNYNPDNPVVPQNWNYRHEPLHMGFNVGAGDWNSRPYAGARKTLLTKPSPQLHIFEALYMLGKQAQYQLSNSPAQ